MDSENHQEFWKKIGKIGTGKERQKNIPMEVILPYGDISSDTKSEEFPEIRPLSDFEKMSAI